MATGKSNKVGGCHGEEDRVGTGCVDRDGEALGKANKRRDCAGIATQIRANEQWRCCIGECL